jgi:hypothetical protein
VSVERKVVGTDLGLRRGKNSVQNVCIVLNKLFILEKETENEQVATACPRWDDRQSKQILLSSHSFLKHVVEMLLSVLQT